MGNNNISGFTIAVKAKALLAMIARVCVFSSKYITISATKNCKVMDNNGSKFFSCAMRFSQENASGRAYTEKACAYIPFVRTVNNAGTEDESYEDMYLSDPHVEEAKAVVDVRLLTEVVKQLADDESVSMTFWLDKKQLTILKKKGSIQTDKTLPLAEEAAVDEIGGVTELASGIVTAESLKGIGNGLSDGTVRLSFGQTDIEAFLQGAASVCTMKLRADQFTSKTDAAFYGVKAEDYTSILRGLKEGEKLKLSALGTDSPKFIQISSAERNLSYILPMYGTIVPYNLKEVALSKGDFKTRTIQLEFCKEELAKAFKVVATDYDAKKLDLTMVLQNGESLTIRQSVDGKKADKSTIPAKVNVVSRVKNYGPHWNDPADGPIEIAVYYKEFQKALNMLPATEDGKCHVTIHELVIVFDDMCPGDSMLQMIMQDKNAVAEFREFQKAAMAEKAAEPVPKIQAPAQAETDAAPFDEGTVDTINEGFAVDDGEYETDIKTAIAAAIATDGETPEAESFEDDGADDASVEVDDVEDLDKILAG